MTAFPRLVLVCAIPQIGSREIEVRVMKDNQSFIIMGPEYVVCDSVYTACNELDKLNAQYKRELFIATMEGSM